MSADQIPAWFHLRPPEMTTRRPQKVDLPPTDPNRPPWGWVPRTNFKNIVKYLNDLTIQEAKFNL